MTKQELNRDIKRLYKQYLNKADKEAIEPEFKRLYYADDNFEYCNKNSVLMLLAMNHTFRFIQFHLFGISCEESITV